MGGWRERSDVDVIPAFSSRGSGRGGGAAGLTRTEEMTGGTVKDFRY